MVPVATDSIFFLNLFLIIFFFFLYHFSNVSLVTVARFCVCFEITGLPALATRNVMLQCFANLDIISLLSSF